MTESILILFCLLAATSSLLILFTNNPIHAIFFLILTVTILAIILLILGVEFFAMVLLIVYIGAIAVLFLFVIMFLKLKTTTYTHNVDKRFLYSNLITLYILVFTMLYLTKPFAPANNKSLVFTWNFAPTQVTNTEIFGYLLFPTHAALFIILTLVLIIALIGAMLLILTQTISTSRQQSKIKQLSQKSKIL